MREDSKCVVWKGTDILKIKPRLNNRKLSSFLIAILPILSIYKVWALPLTFGDVAVVFIMVGTLLSGFKRKLKFPKIGFIVFFIGFFILSAVSILLRGQGNLEDFVSKWLRIAVYYFVIDFSCSQENQFDFVYMQKCCMFAGIFVSAVLLVQVIMAQFFGQSLTFFLPMFPLNYNSTPEQLTNYYNIHLNDPSWRPISIFCEPAHYAQFTCLPLAISLFCDETVMSQKSKWFVSLFLSATILLSFSANGIFVTVLLWAMWYYRYMQGRTTAKKNIIGFLAIIIGIFVLAKTDFWNFALDRLDTVRSSGSTTGTVRLLQGIEIYKKLSFPEKIFGIGFGNIQTFLIENRITTAYLSDLGNEYMNGFSTVLVSGGIVGLLLYLAIWIRLYFTHRDSIARATFMVISVLFCTSSIFYSCTSVMYLAFVICSCNEIPVLAVRKKKSRSKYRVTNG